MGRGRGVGIVELKNEPLNTVSYLISALLSFSKLSIPDGIVGEYYYITNDLHHPTLSILQLKSNNDFRIKRSNFVKAPFLLIKGEYKVSTDTLFLVKHKVILNKNVKHFKKLQVTNCNNQPNELDCPADTFLIKADGFYEYQYFENPQENGWILKYRKNTD
jgi:hypothetical protein